MSAQYRGDTSNNALASHLREQDDRLATLEVKMDAILNCLKWLLGTITFIGSATIVGVLIHFLTT
jgi:hypothetical protein